MYITSLTILFSDSTTLQLLACADTLSDGVTYWMTNTTAPDTPVQSQHVTACQNNTVTAAPLNQTYIDGMEQCLTAYDQQAEGSW